MENDGKYHLIVSLKSESHIKIWRGGKKYGNERAEWKLQVDLKKKKPVRDSRQDKPQDKPHTRRLKSPF